MQKIDTAELRRMWHKSEDPSVVGLDWANTRHAMHDQFLALLDELEALREALSQIYWKSIELGEDRGDSTINHIAADALRGDTSPLHARDRRMKLIGAAEELERSAKTLREDLADMNPPEFASRGKVAPGYCECLQDVADGMEERAAQLRREAEK